MVYNIIIEKKQEQVKLTLLYHIIIGTLLTSLCYIYIPIINQMEEQQVTA